MGYINTANKVTDCGINLHLPQKIWLHIKKEFTTLVLRFLIVFPPTLKTSPITQQNLKQPLKKFYIQIPFTY